MAAVFWTYLRRELGRRKKQAIVTSLGLAIGIGLVMIVSATSAGVKTAQSQVLHSLYGVGTDMTVTKTATPGSGGGLHFGGFGSGTTTRPAAGTQISRNTLRPTPGEGTLAQTDVTRIARLPGAAAATGGLMLTDTSFSGTIPNFTPGSFGGGGSSSSSSPSFTIDSFSVDGVQYSRSGVGPLNPTQLTKGSFFTPDDGTAKVAILSSSFASSRKLPVGSSISVAGTDLKVIGIADTGTGSADAYIPLGTAQKLAGLKGDVTDIFVSAQSATAVSSLDSKVSALLPKATVETSASLANEVTGSLSSASDLASNLGKWLSIAALVVAFLVAGLLMMAAVSRRVREFGTLKAVGWRTRRVVGQVMGEGLAMGILGGLAGIVVGIIGIEVVSAISPTLSATTGSPFSTGGGFGGNGGFGSRFGGGAPGGFTRPTTAGGAPARSGFARNFAGEAHTVLVHLTAPLQGGALGIAIGLAIAGGLVAGAFGAWRAARLRPAAALRKVE